MAKNDEQKSGQNQPEGKPRFNQQQYDLLKRCSDKKDMTEWNKWRKENPGEEICLQGAFLRGANLTNADLRDAHLENTDLRISNLENANLSFAHLENAELTDTHLENSDLSHAHLENTRLVNAHLEDTNLECAHLENTDLWQAHLEKANLMEANLGNANLLQANLENAYLSYAYIENANLSYAHLEHANLEHAHLENSSLKKACMERANLSYAFLHGTDFSGTDLKKSCGCYSHMKGTKLSGTDLKGACFRWVIVDGSTLFMECEIDCCVDFYGVGLGAMRIGSETKQLLEYNSRRKNWEEWYKEHFLLQWPVKLFWSFSDYGKSTWRIIGWFFLLALAFAAVYANCACWWPPGIVNNLDVEPHLPLWHYFILVLLRPVYFSIVTMTTLGFGDMHANETSIWGHALLTFQVILGYVLLGALVTRFAVLFTAGGPAGKFSPSKTKETGEGEKHKE